MAGGASALGNIESDVARVGAELSRSIQGVLGALPGYPAGPQQLAVLLGEDKGTISRLLKALRSRDPIAVAHVIPGPDTLRRVLASAERAGVDPGLIAESHQTVARFGDLIRSVSSDRATFDGVVSHLLPEARERFGNRTKQQIYRGISQLKGVSVDVDFVVSFIHPSSMEGHLDYATISGVLGLHRLRPNATIRFAERAVRRDGGELRVMDLNGRPISDDTGGRLDRFCTGPLADVRMEECGDAVYFCLDGAGFGPKSAVDFVLGHRCTLAAGLNSRPGERHLSGVGVEVDKPARFLQFDTLVHESVYAGVEPQLLIYDTAFRGPANMNDPTRFPDRLNHEEKVQYLGRGFSNIRSSHVPSYPEMLQLVIDSSCWDPSSFRVFRVLIAYPIYGMQVTLGFERPQLS